MQTTPGAFQLLEVRMVHDLVELGRQLLVHLGDPELDVRLDVFGDNLTRLYNLVEELFEKVLGTFGLFGALRPSCRNHLVQKAGGFGRSRRGSGAGGLFGSTHLDSSVLGASIPISFARAMAF